MTQNVEIVAIEQILLFDICRSSLKEHTPTIKDLLVCSLRILTASCITLRCLPLYSPVWHNIEGVRLFQQQVLPPALDGWPLTSLLHSLLAVWVRLHHQHTIQIFIKKLVKLLIILSFPCMSWINIIFNLTVKMISASCSAGLRLAPLLLVGRYVNTAEKVVIPDTFLTHVGMLDTAQPQLVILCSWYMDIYTNVHKLRHPFVGLLRLPPLPVI